MSDWTDDIDPETRANLAHARRLPETLAGQPEARWPSLGALLAARAEAAPDKIFLTFRDDEGRGESCTYRALWDAARQAAALMAGPLELRAGDRIGTLMINDPRTVLIYFGAWLLGVTVVPINCGEDDERICFILENAEVSVVFALDDYVERCRAMQNQLPRVRRYVQVGGAPAASFLPFDSARAAEPPLDPLPDLRPETECLIVYTSGTTGPPKGVVLEHANLLADARSIAAWHGFGPDDRALCVLPLHHVNGTVVTLVTPLLSGGSVVLQRRFRTQTFWRTLAGDGCTWVSVVPTVLAFLCEGEADLSGYDLHRFRHFVCGAGPLTTDLAARFHAQFGLRVVHGYGLSETTCYSCFLPPGLDEDRYRYWMTECGFPSIGCPLDVNLMAIHDPDGRSLPPEHRGEIVVRGENVMRYYFKRPDANRDTFAHGWFRSGDEGFFQMGDDGRSYFFITGRLKELIIRGGVNYSPFDIDEVLNAIPGVRAAMAVGFDNRWYGEEIGAYVQREEGALLTEDEILQACRQKLPFAKSPKVVVFGDTFPVTSTGKYQRLKLKPLFERWRDSEFRGR